MALDNLQVDYLIDPAFQIENLAGKPAVGGHIEVFEAGTDTKVITYQDFDGNVNPFKIPLHSDGRAVILADPSRKYDFYVYDSFNNLMFSRLNVTPNLSGNISIKGCDVYIYNTDGTLDITQQSIQNNIRRYEINTKHKSLGVEAPLYFVEDSDTATIIGFSGDDYATKDYVDSAVSSKLDISSYSSQSGEFLTDKFEYDDEHHITAYNHSAFAAGAGSGTIYEAGDHIDITNNVISVTGLPTSSDVVSSAVTNVENKFEYNENNYITAYNNSAFAGTNYSAGDYVSIENDTISVTGLQPSGDYATHDDLTAYQPSGDYATKEDVESATSGKMDVTGMTAYQPTGDYATHDDLTAYQPVGDYYSASNPSGFITNDAITGLQPSGDYVTHDEMTAYQPSGNYATLEDVESATSGKQDTLSAGYGISIINNTISVTSQGGGIEQVNHDNTLSGNGNSDPLGIANIEDFVKQDDLTAYQPAGDYYSASNPSGFLTKTSADTLYAPAGDYATHDDLTAYQPSGNYADATALDGKVDTSSFTAFSSTTNEKIEYISGALSGTYELSAGEGIDITDYPNEQKTVISVTAQGGNPEVENLVIANSATWDSVTGKADATALHDYATTSQLANKLDTSAFSDVSGTFLTAVPDTYLQNTDLTIVDNKITEISGVPLSAGDELPSGVMNTSALEYNAVGEISGYGNSAIAQYGAEKQWLQHDDTLVHAANSAQYALGVNLSAVAQLLGVDETVLWEGADPLDQSCLVNGTRETATLSEPLSSFNKIRIYAVWNPWLGNYTGCNTFEYPGTNNKGAYIMNATDNANYLAGGSWSATNTTFTLIKHWQAVYGQAKETANGLGGIFKVIGIGRKEV